MEDDKWGSFCWVDLLGEDDDTGCEQLFSRLVESAKTLHELTSCRRYEYGTLQNKSASLNEVIAFINNTLATSSIEDKIVQHKRFQNATCLVVLESKLDKLRRYKHIKEIPNLIIELLTSERTTFSLLADNLLMKTVLLETMDEMKCKISESFNIEFEDHLLIDIEETSKDGTSNASVMDMITTKKWLHFLSKAVDYILSYVLISILPTSSIILSTKKENENGHGNKNDDFIVYERYKESLDEILIPFWSKFYFHLSTAREEKSTEQLLWTFKYTASFVGIIIQLCDKLESTTILQQLYKGNYRQINYDYIYSVSLRLLRAHIAQCTVLLSKEINLIEIKNDLIQFIENVLQLDDKLRLLLNQTIQKSDTTLISVLCNAPFIHQIWIDTDLNYIKQKESKFLSRPLVCELKFGTSAHSKYKCFGNIYETFSLFLLFCKRYKYNSEQSQQAFSNLIIEPLLCTCIAILWLKVKSSENLRNISNGIIKHGFKAEFEEFLGCCDYLIKCFDEVPMGLRNIAVICGFEYTFNETKKRIQEDEEMPDGLFELVLLSGKISKGERVRSTLEASIDIAKLAVVKLSSTLKRKVEAGLEL